MNHKYVATAGLSIVVSSVLGLFLAHPARAQSLPYGANTCINGYVWREAKSGDVVCVTPATRTQTAYDNAQARNRVQPGGGAYGPNTCLQGYVWREAYAGDIVCVTPATRAQSASDNAQAAKRKATQMCKICTQWSKGGNEPVGTFPTCLKEETVPCGPSPVIH